MKEAVPIYFNFEKTHDLFFKYPLVPGKGDDVIKVRVHGNFARHF